MSQSSKFDGGRELELIRQENPLLGSLLQRAIDAMNHLAKNAGVGVLGPTEAPPPVNSVQVQGTVVDNVLTAPGEILHWTHVHNAPIQRGIQYITEIDTDPNFSNPHPIDAGSSRSGFTHLPTLDDSGNPVGYYMRVTPQYPGSGPQKPTVFGGLQGPTKIVFSGTTRMTLLASQSGGTAKPGQGGQGIGKVQTRTAVGGPKRALPNTR